jgi:hypothetical protein
MSRTVRNPDPFLLRIVDQFLPGIPVASVLPYGSGHIHKTFHVVTGPGHGFNYILQQINHTIFKDIPGIQENIYRVTRHIHQKTRTASGSNISRETLMLIPAKNGLLYFQDYNGNSWRLFNFIEGSHSFQKPSSVDIAREAGKSFGRFQQYLEDLEGEPLHETIPEFHRIEKRLESFEQTLKTGVKDRIGEACHEIDMIRERSARMCQFTDDAYAAKIPLRVTHNDTKLNNVLFDENNKALCVIDLDTVMPGFVFYDFGDAIRTIANTGEEDEMDLSNVSLDISMFRAFSDGFLAEAGKSLIQGEIGRLAFSCQYMTYIIGLRFLIDYLQGDWYFKIHREKHNLERARVQLRLLEDMERKYKEMQHITENQNNV